MAAIKTLEERMQVLEDVESIKKLKARYFRCVDGKRWDDLSKVFTEDAVTDYGMGRRFEGVNAILDFFKNRSNSGSEWVTGFHHGHNPEIEITSSVTARGTWALYNYMIDKQTHVNKHFGASYNDEYFKEKGEWKIKSTAVTFTVKEAWDRHEIPF